MPLDEMTRRNLELVESLRGGEGGGTLLSILDRTLTPMGSRLLRQWILTPLTDRSAIEARLDAVELFAGDPVGREAVRDALDGVRDIERLGSKAAAGRGTPRDLRALGDSVARLPRLYEALEKTAGPADGERNPLAALMARWDGCADIAADIIAPPCRTRPLRQSESEWPGRITGCCS